MTYLHYKPPILLKGGHLQTIYPSLFRKTDHDLNPGFYIRERIETPDNDFIDLDWSKVGSSRLAIISHGLEGNSGRTYVTGMVQAMNRAGLDAVAWNFRSCSGEPNRLLRSYHNGVTEDLAWVIRHAEEMDRYRKIYLVGFSLGGNLTLNYLGREKVASTVRKAVVFSVPCDLK
ncbi:YheT family hydrolase, partial [Desulfamplus magnetovallimortis]|uniref:YheT family hydrolase n=1 Tax=Desulfamplus magnetovallimortis TaxID=1246637 RepID=UPI0011182E70